MKNLKKYIYTASILLFTVILLTVTFNHFYHNTTHTEISENPAVNKVTYQGRRGIDAYTLLKKNAEIKEADSGFITSINGRKAEEDKKEFWAFYVNGEKSNVGPRRYITKDADTIVWKIENY